MTAKTGTNAPTPLDDLRSVADELAEKWDVGMKAGKLLAHLEGRISQYDPRITRIVEALSPPASTAPSPETFDTIRQWAEETFGPITAARTIERAGEEFEELRADPSDISEAADVVICLARMPGLAAEIDRKMRVNRERQWRLVGDGTGYHVKPAAQAIE